MCEDENRQGWVFKEFTKYLTISCSSDQHEYLFPPSLPLFSHPQPAQFIQKGSYKTNLKTEACVYALLLFQGHEEVKKEVRLTYWCVPSLHASPSPYIDLPKAADAQLPWCDMGICSGKVILFLNSWIHWRVKACLCHKHMPASYCYLGASAAFLIKIFQFFVRLSWGFLSVAAFQIWAVSHGAEPREQLWEQNWGMQKFNFKWLDRREFRAFSVWLLERLSLFSPHLQLKKHATEVTRIKIIKTGYHMLKTLYIHRKRGFPSSSNTIIYR